MPNPQPLLGFAFSCVVLLAGCTDPAGQPDSQGRQDAEPTDVLQGAGWLNSTFTYLQSPGVTFNVEGANCVFFSAPGFDITVDRIIEGSVEATWTTPNPLLNEMALFMQGESHDAVQRGTSPLRVELHNLTADSRIGIVAFLRSDSGPSVDSRVDMAMHWSITYDGRPGPEVSTGGCG